MQKDPAKFIDDDLFEITFLCPRGPGYLESLNLRLHRVDGNREYIKFWLLSAVFFLASLQRLFTTEIA